MKSMRIVSLLAVFLTLLFADGYVFASSGKNYVEGELLVKYQKGTVSADSFVANSLLGAKVVEEFPDLGWQLVKLPANTSVEQALSQFANFAGVETVQPNYIYNLAATPNDTGFGALYGLQKISAPTAWDVTSGSPNIVVAVIDTGVRYTHEDLAANVWKNSGEIAGNNIDDDGNGFVDDVNGWDFFYNDADPMDENGHGTHVAGIIGAVGNNALGVTGVNWNVRIMPIKIYNASGNGSTSAMLVNAYNYVRMMKLRGVNIRVTNNSYGGCDEACGYDQATKDAIDRLGEANVLNVFAAGNNNQNIDNAPYYPASYTSPSILTVAASDSADAKGSFSNYGSQAIDLAAPGVSIFSTFNGTNSSYTYLSGTSMAAPHASGAAALLAAANPNLSAASLKATLMNTVDPINGWSNFVKTGGRLNVAKAVQQQTVCNFSLSQPFEIVIGYGGGTSSINVTAPANCDYSIESQASWITVTNGNIGSGSKTINFTVSPFLGVQRSGFIRIAGQDIKITQVTEQAPTTNNACVLDFDGDGRTDYSVVQNSNSSLIWHNFNSRDDYQIVNFGLIVDAPVPADYDGDGKTDIAVWREGAQSYFYVLNSRDNTFRAVNWGTNGDFPSVTQDFDGDGKADFAVTRRANGQLFWYIWQSSSNSLRAQQFGVDTDIPIRGDYDGDRKADLAIYRPTAGNPANTFIVLNSQTNNFAYFNFGNSATDKVVPGDYDCDGRTDFAVFRTTNGTWYAQQSRDGFRAVQFGVGTDLPVPGDYDGDGKTDFAVWRPNVSANEPAMFYVQRSSAASSSNFTAFGWGQNAMRPVANALQVGR